MKTKYNLGDFVWNLKSKYVDDKTDKSLAINRKTRQIRFYEIHGPLKIVKIELEVDKITYWTTNGSYKESELLGSFDDVAKIVKSPKEVVENLLDNLHSAKQKDDVDSSVGTSLNITV